MLPLETAGFWAQALGSNVDGDSTEDRAFVEAPGWGGPNLWFVRVPEGKTAKNRIHFDLRALRHDRRRRLLGLEALGATVLTPGRRSGGHAGPGAATSPASSDRGACAPLVAAP